MFTNVIENSWKCQLHLEIGYFLYLQMLIHQSINLLIMLPIKLSYPGYSHTSRTFDKFKFALNQ